MNTTERNGYGLEPPPPPDSAPPDKAPKAKPLPKLVSSQHTMGEVLAQQRRQRKDAAKLYEETSVTRNAYRIPFLMLGIGAAVTCGILLVTGGVPAVIAYLLSFAASVPVGIIVYLVCCAIWIGSNERIHLVILQLTGIYAVTDAMLTAMGQPPLFTILWFVTMLVYVGLLAEQLDIELKDAIIVGLLTFIAKEAIKMVIIVAAF